MAAVDEASRFTAEPEQLLSGCSRHGMVGSMVCQACSQASSYMRLLRMLGGKAEGGRV
jgi:hypothetical protein